MWNIVVTILTTAAPLLLSAASLVVHFFVFHRLKCTKNLSDCMRTCLPYITREMQKDVPNLYADFLDPQAFMELKDEVEALRKDYRDFLDFFRKIGFEVHNGNND